MTNTRKPTATHHQIKKDPKWPPFDLVEMMDLHSRPRSARGACAGRAPARFGAPLRKARAGGQGCPTLKRRRQWSPAPQDQLTHRGSDAHRAARATESGCLKSPRLASQDGVTRNVFTSLRHAGQQFAVRGPAWCKADAAVADQSRRDTVPAEGRDVGIPSHPSPAGRRDGCASRRNLG